MQFPMQIPTISLIAMTFSALSVVVALAMLILVVWQAPRERDNQLMALYMLSVVFWGINAFLLRFVPIIHYDPTPYFYSIALAIGFNGLLLYAVVSHYANRWKRWYAGPALIAGLLYYFVTIPLLYQGKLYTGVAISETGRLQYTFLPLGYASFVVSYIFFLGAMLILWRHRRTRAGHLLAGGILISLGVLSSLTPLSQFSFAIASAGITTILFARAILNENLFYPLAVLNKELATANQQLSTLAEELRVANIQLTEVSRLKSHFLANMSHELRTPLNSIIGYTEMLNDGVYGPLTDKQRDRLDRVTRNGQHLLQLINDILDLSKIEAGRMELAVEPVDVNQVIEACVATLEPLAQKKGLELVRLIPNDLPMILADRSRLVQVLTNLVSNSVKFTESGAVTVRVQPITLSQVKELPIQLHEGSSGPWVLMTVDDTGIGIGAEDQKIIFDEFRQADGSPTRQYEGTGLGLSITRRLVEMMYGYIWLTSVQGQGSTFHVLLPLVADVVTEAVQEDERGSPVTNGQQQH
jgi:signal transduction histidine kinase